jgi:hypothetical protein
MQPELRQRREGSWRSCKGGVPNVGAGMTIQASDSIGGFRKIVGF